MPPGHALISRRRARLLMMATMIQAAESHYLNRAEFIHSSPFIPSSKQPEARPFMPVPVPLPDLPATPEAIAYQRFTDAVAAHTAALADPTRSRSDRFACALDIKRAWQSFMMLASEGLPAAEGGSVVIARESYAFMVWRRSGGRAPRFRHQTLHQASDEALRLSKERPGDTFLVLQEICRFKNEAARPKPQIEKVIEVDQLRKAG